MSAARHRLVVAAVVGAGLVLAAGLGIVLWGLIATPGIPFQDMLVQSGDVGEVATIQSPYFTVALEGLSLGTQTRADYYLIDGRFWNWAPWGSSRQPVRRRGGGVEYVYSQKRRSLTIRCDGHEIAYVHPRQAVVIDGREFSLSGGAAHFQVKPDGRIVPGKYAPSGSYLTRRQFLEKGRRGVRSVKVRR